MKNSINQSQAWVQFNMRLNRVWTERNFLRKTKLLTIEWSCINREFFCELDDLEPSTVPRLAVGVRFFYQICFLRHNPTTSVAPTHESLEAYSGTKQYIFDSYFWCDFTYLKTIFLWILFRKLDTLNLNAEAEDAFQLLPQLT